MPVAYFDCFSGISGTMALGALLNAGADLELIGLGLASLPTVSFELEREDVDVRGIPAVRVHVRSHPQEVVRTYSSIRSMLEEADLPEDVRHTSQRAFRLLAEAEAGVAGRERDLVTFYEAGEPDVLVAIVGTALALHQLEIDRVFASALPTGSGMATHEHGLVPIPSPVVMELLKGAPTYSRGIPVELVSAAGAAILGAVVEGFGDRPAMRVERVGYGAGQLGKRSGRGLSPRTSSSSRPACTRPAPRSSVRSWPSSSTPAPPTPGSSPWSAPTANPPWPSRPWSPRRFRVRFERPCSPAPEAGPSERCGSRPRAEPLAGRPTGTRQ